MPVSKSRRGGAYIMVLTAVMLIVLLVTIALSVTAVSRRLTAYYAYHVGLYDLAVSGNEHALFLLSQHFINHSDAIYNRAWERAIFEIPITIVFENGSYRLDSITRGNFQRILIEEAMMNLHAMLRSTYPRGNAGYEIAWGLDAVIYNDEHMASDSFRATTSLNLTTNNTRFSTITEIRKYTNDTPGHPTSVGASLIWVEDGNREIILDALTIITLDLHNAILPDTLLFGENVILNLDEFTLTMVESLRIAN